MYPWKRFWFPVIEGINAPISDDGYLDEPDSDFRRHPSIPYETLETLKEKECLVLLGSQGLGKSTVLEQTLPTLRNSIEDAGDLLVHHNLKQFGDENKLIQEIFNADVLKPWKEGNNKLYLFLDSLDECHIEITNLNRILISEFKKLPVERLYLRLVCRTADWLVSLEKGLKETWGEDSVEIYELLPLLEEDVSRAAERKGIKPETFLRDITEKKIGPLAAKPITLEFLINPYLEENGFPTNQVELYAKGLKYLCEEYDYERRDAGHQGKFTPQQRLITASRLAYISIFANRSGMWNGIDDGSVPEEYFLIAEAHGLENLQHVGPFNIDEFLVKETLTTGLFSSRGGRLMGWAHKTFEEFLAAFYLKEHDLDLKQIIGLITNNDKIVPSLKGTAGWLAGLKPDFLNYMIKNDPDILLESDLVIGDSDRETIVDSLLRQFSGNLLIDFGYRFFSYYAKLNHPNLAGQLKKCIRQAINNETMIAAINIASACKVSSIIDDLIAVLFNPQCGHPVKVAAAYAIRRIADEITPKQVGKLKPLAFGKGAEDSDDEIKGCALQLLWPHYLSLDELFACLTMPKRNNFIGSYTSFIGDLSRVTWDKDLNRVLEFMRDQPGSISYLSSLRDSILQKAWYQLDSEGIFENFIPIFLYSMRYDSSVLRLFEPLEQDYPGEIWVDNDEKRHQVLERMFPLLKDIGYQIYVLSPLFGNRPIVLKRDIQWLLKCLGKASLQEERWFWRDLLSSLFNINSINDLNTIIEMSHQETMLNEILNLNPVLIDSTEDERFKNNSYRSQHPQEETAGEDNSQKQVEKINQLLQAFNEGDLSAWKGLVFTIEENPASESDLINSRIWKQLSADVQIRIIDAAEKFLINHHPSGRQWIEENALSSLDYSGYHAFCLLRDKNPSTFASLSKETWVKWAPILLGFHYCYPDKHREMVKQVYQNAPGKVGEILSIFLAKIEKADIKPSILDIFDLCWDQDLVGIIEPYLEKKNLKLDSLANLLPIALKHGSQAGRHATDILVSQPIPEEGADRKNFVLAFKNLIVSAPDACWSSVWPIFHANEKFGKEVVAELLHGFSLDFTDFKNKITEDQLADFYIWLEKLYPTDKELWIEFGVAGTEHFVDHFKNSALNDLRDRGTPDACKAIEKIWQAFPSMTWLEKILYMAKYNTREKTWQPHQIMNLFELIKSRDNRLVGGDSQLMDIVVESLERLEKKLHDETPAIRDLWDRSENDTWRPVDENDFSDYIKRHLDEDLTRRGIIINREVRIHRGQKTDIHVDAVKKDGDNDAFQTIKVIIEVKGCWNRELNTAMKKQLIGQYLNNNSCRKGIYLVGWFDCKKWDEYDNRKKSTPRRISLSDARKKFSGQAEKLSAGKDYQIRAFVMDTALS